MFIKGKNTEGNDKSEEFVLREGKAVKIETVARAFELDPETLILSNKAGQIEEFDDLQEGKTYTQKGNLWVSLSFHFTSVFVGPLDLRLFLFFS